VIINLRDSFSDFSSKIRETPLDAGSFARQLLGEWIRNLIMTRVISKLALCAIGFAMSLSAIPASAKGVIKGAAKGAVVGHVMGHHGKAGAAIGAVHGHHKAAKKAKKAAKRAH
jgi:hypothetical protein